MTKQAKRVLCTLVLLLAGVAVTLGAVVYTNPLGVNFWAQRWSLGRAGLEEREIDAPGGRLAVWTAGQGKTLVLVHSLTSHAGAWKTVAPALLERYRLVIPDLPGHGDSAPEEGELTLRGELDGLAAAIQELGGSDRVVLIGNGFGGWLSLIYARERPERVERLVLVNSVGLSFDSTGLNTLPENREQAQHMVEALGDPEVRPAPGFVLDDMIEKLREGPWPRILNNLRTMDLLDDRMPEVRVPADLIWGETDGIIRREVTLRLLDGLPGARLHVLPQCGHLPQQQCPEAFLKTLLDVLGSPPPPVPAPF